MDILERLRGGLVVSCQPVDNGPMDDPAIVAAMAQAAVAGGAVGLRIEGVENLKATRGKVNVPIIGIVKRDLTNTDVRITPFIRDAEALIDEGADIVGYDATNRSRPDPKEAVLQMILSAGKLAMADCSTLEDAREAVAQGASIVGSTLSGYVGENASSTTPPDFALLSQLSKLDAFVMAEGRYNTPEYAREAIAAGADSVTIGSALTRLEIATSWFVDALK